MAQFYLMGSYLEEFSDNLFDIIEDFFFKHLGTRQKKQRKRADKTLKEANRPALSLAKRIRGVINIMVGLSVRYTAFIGKNNMG